MHMHGPLNLFLCLSFPLRCSTVHAASFFYGHATKGCCHFNKSGIESFTTYAVLQTASPPAPRKNYELLLSLIRFLPSFRPDRKVFANMSNKNVEVRFFAFKDSCVPLQPNSSQPRDHEGGRFSLLFALAILECVVPPLSCCDESYRSDVLMLGLLTESEPEGFRVGAPSHQVIKGFGFLVAKSANHRTLQSSLS